MQGLYYDLCFGTVEEIVLDHKVQFFCFTFFKQLSQGIIALIIDVVQFIDSSLPPVAAHKKKGKHDQPTTHHGSVEAATVHVFDLGSDNVDPQ